MKKFTLWILFAAAYLVSLLLAVLFFNPDFSQMENCLLFVPLFIFIARASSIYFKNEPDNRKNRLVIVCSWSGCSAIVVLFQWLIK